MRVASVFSAAVSLAMFGLALASDSATEQEAVPEILASAAFPETNAFNQVVNGEKNAMTVTVENKSGRNVTLVNIGGAFVHPDTQALLKNITTSKYGIPLINDMKLQIPFSFHSELKPGDHRLNIWLEHTTEDGTFRTEAYDSIVTVVDPALSIFDLKLLSTYAIVAALLSGLVYLAYTTFVPQQKKSRARKPTTDSVSAPVGTVTATGAGGYQEEWIPEHHLRKTKAGKKQSGVISGTSGDELSGVETSGTEGKRRKGKK